MQRQPWTTIVGCLAVTWMITSARPAFGQPNVSRSAPTLGATVGIVSAGEHRLDGGGEGLAVNGNIDLPTAPGWRVRLGAGILGWTPPRDPHGDAPRAGRIRLAHVAVSGIRNYIEPGLRFPLGLYWGGGIGYYRYRVQRGPLTNPTSHGYHAIGGFEYQQFDRDIGVRLEAQVHLTRAPGRPHVRAYSLPAASLALGITKKF